MGITLWSAKVNQGELLAGKVRRSAIHWRALSIEAHSYGNVVSLLESSRLTVGLRAPAWWSARAIMAEHQQGGAPAPAR